jgi:hypothetical protein
MQMPNQQPWKNEVWNLDENKLLEEDFHGEFIL